MEISTEQIKALRDQTGISVMQCRKALEQAGGDVEKALFFLRKQGAEMARKKSERTLGAGVVAGYVHSTGAMGALVELQCETDFVAKNPEFKALAYDIAMQVAASAPAYLAFKDIPEETKESMRKLFAEEGAQSGKSAEMQTKMLDGKLTAYFKEKTLLDQPFIKNPELTIDKLIESGIQKFGEKVEIGKFSRLALFEK